MLSDGLRQPLQTISLIGFHGFVFFLQSLKRQKDHLVHKLEEQGKPEVKSKRLSPEAQKIMDYVNVQGRITTSEAVKMTQAPRSTVKFWLSKLVEDGHLFAHGKGRGAWYGMED